MKEQIKLSVAENKNKRDTTLPFVTIQYHFVDENTLNTIRKL